MAIKRKLCLFLSALLLTTVLLSGQAGFASSNVVFTVVNNVLLHTVTDEDMAYLKDGEPYVPYTVMMRMPGLKFYYNTQNSQLSIYNYDLLLVFDMQNQTTFDELKNTYSLGASVKNGTVYVPVSLVCKKFNLYYSLITISALGPVIRINSERPSYSDSVLIEVMAPSMSEIYSEYQEWKNKQETSGPVNSNPGTSPNTPSPPDSDPAKQAVYPVFTGDPGEQGAAVLSQLDAGKMKGTFFFTADEILNSADFIRKLASSGHSVGLYLSEQDVSRLNEALDEGNQVLKSILRTQTRLVYLPAGVKLSDKQREELVLSGYRLWQGNLFPETEKADLTVSWRRRQYLSEEDGTLVPVFSFNARSVQLLPGFLSDFKKEDYSVLSIHEWNTPVNSLEEIR